MDYSKIRRAASVYPGKLADELYRKYYQLRRLQYQFYSARSNAVRSIATQSPGILIISLPRSGSSWVGSILGAADNAIYLREPLNQAYLANGGDGTVFPVDENALPPGYAAAAAAAFQALPAFDPGIVPHPRQWTPSGRAGRRVVVKEVNPFICDWLARVYRPRMVLLLRHPAAIAQSYDRLGWDLSYAPLGTDPDEPFWTRHGDFQARALRHILDFSERYDDFKTVHYEDICANPIDRFRELFAHCQLDWSEEIEQRIVRQSSHDDASSSYATTKNSRVAVDAWRQTVSPQQLAEARQGYQRHLLPCYQSDEDWLA